MVAEQRVTHTPGPWSVTRAIFDEETGEVSYVLDGVTVADANTARLIGAAPDLLAALERIVRHHRECQSDCWEPEAVAAIARARGEAVGS